MRRLEVNLDRQNTTRLEGPPVLENHGDQAEKSVDEWSQMTVKNMFEAASQSVADHEEDANS